MSENTVVGLNTVVGPCTSGMPYFTITTDLDPKKLASASTALLGAVEARPKLTKAFRLEVKLLQNSAELRICLDTIAWYDCYLRTNSDLRKVIEIARKYVSITRSEISPDEDGPFTIDYQESEKEKAYIRCTKKHEDQDSIAKCTFDHPKIVCNEEVTTRDGRKTTCNFYFPSKFIVQDLSTTNYVVLLRREPIRELLMLPCCNHFNNEMLVKNIDFWNELLNQWRRLTFYSIALNYGQWETKQSRDKYSQSCHAHVHLYFDKEAWNDVKRLVRDHEIIAKMNARDYPGQNYLLENCMELEQQRLLLAEHQYMLNINKSLVKTITQLSEDLKNNNNSLITTITNSNNSLVGAITNLSENIGNAIANLSENIGNLVTPRSHCSGREDRYREDRYAREDRYDRGYGGRGGGYREERGYCDYGS